MRFHYLIKHLNKIKRMNNSLLLLLGGLVAFGFAGSIFAETGHTCYGHAGHKGFNGNLGAWIGPIVTTEDPPTETQIYSNATDNCSCGDNLWAYKDTARIKHSWNVAGTVNVNLKSGLVLAVAAKANATVEITAGYSGEIEKIIEISVNKTMPECTRHQYKKFKTKNSASGTQQSAQYQWADDDGHSGKCIVTTMKADCIGWSGDRDVFSSPGPCVGYPCSPKSCGR